MGNSRNNRVEQLELVGLPLSIQVIYHLDEAYGRGKIPLGKAENTLADTRGVLLDGRSTDFVLDKLEKFGVISFEEDETGRYIVAHRDWNKN